MKKKIALAARRLALANLIGYSENNLKNITTDKIIRDFRSSEKYFIHRDRVCMGLNRARVKSRKKQKWKYVGWKAFVFEKNAKLCSKLQISQLLHGIYMELITAFFQNSGISAGSALWWDKNCDGEMGNVFQRSELSEPTSVFYLSLVLTVDWRHTLFFFFQFHHSLKYSYPKPKWKLKGLDWV